MDIRSFFSPGFNSKSSSSGDEFTKRKKAAEKNDKDKTTKKKKSNKKRTLDSDSDEEPLPPKLRKTSSSKSKVFKESDDEDNDLVVVSVKTKNKGEKGKSTSSKKKAEAPIKASLKPTNADDFFGSTPIEQKAKPILHKKKEPKEEKKGKTKTEKKPRIEEKQLEDLCEDMFDDDEFEKSLHEMDTDVPHTKQTKEEGKAKESKRKRELSESPLPPNIKAKKEKGLLEKTTPVKRKLQGQGIPLALDTPEASKKQANEEPKAKAATPSLERKNSGYASYRARDGPRELGSKEIPQGEENCLEGLTFVITGVLESIEREDASDLIKKHGGKVTSSLSKKTSYIVAGRDAGESKMEKAKNFGTKQLDEDALFDLIKTRPGKKSKNDNMPSEKLEEQDVSSKDSVPKLERKKSGYASFKGRDGPRELGSKEIPQGEENCLEGLTFVITGVLESIEREDASDLIKKHGGKVTSSLSKKTSYIVSGRDAGESKMEKAKTFSTKQLDEDALFDLIKTKPGKKSKYDNHPTEKPSAHQKSPSSTKKPVERKSPSTSAATESKYFKNETSTQASTSQNQSQSQRSQNNSQSQNSQYVSQSQSSQYDSQSQRSQNDSQSQRSQSDSHSQRSQNDSQSQRSLSDSQSQSSAEDLLWVDKYKPKSMEKIVGQQGDKSNVKKLYRWLLNWNDNHAKATKPKGKGSFFSAKEDGSIFRCALLSGPPGVGKTTSASLVCKRAGFSYVEMNASDTRSKKTLQQVIAELLSNNTVDSVLKGKKQETGSHALVMDEVDGMAGNEDRGGIQELITLIKNTKIPIICMCNDRNHPKIRSLANHCFDLRFFKPRVEQVKSFAMMVAAREGLNIPHTVMEQIVIGANQDFRQTLHNLQMWTSTKKSMTFDEAKVEAKNSEKNIKVGSFDIVKKLFSASESGKMSIHDKTDLFFNDYSFVPLFVQENYLNSNPASSRGNIRKTLELTSSAADALADSNMVERLIRGGQNWSLLPLQGFLSCVVAPDMMRGGLSQRIEFPQWLGKNSSQNKNDRILQELKVHMRLSSFASKSDINLDYLWLLRQSLSEPLVNAGDDVNEAARKVIDVMDAYNLTREDWESVMEIGKLGSQSDITSSIPSKVKASFTRTYNKGNHKTPYASQTAAKKSKRGGVNLESEAFEEGAEASEDEDEEDISKDSMIKMRKKPAEGAKGKKTKTEPKAKTTGKRKLKSK